MIARNAPLFPLQKDEYEASIPEERKGADDDVTIVSNPDVTNKPDTFGAPKRKRGRARGRMPLLVIQ